MRKLTYAEAFNETLFQILRQNKKCILIGQGVTSPWYVGTTTVGLIEEFGSSRVIDTPVSESCITGTAIGAAINGLHPIVVHPRMDFMYYAMDQIINHASNWHYMFGGQQSVPLTIWSIINRGGEQAAQHSQAIQGLFAHIPGLKVVLPSTPYDVKGLLIASIKDENPVLFVDDRWLYKIKEHVPENMYEVPIGKSIIREEGDDLTIVTSSYLVHEAKKAIKVLNKKNIYPELVDIRTLKPLDLPLIVNSVEKTRKALVLDGAWRSFGPSAEITASIYEECFHYLKKPIQRLALPDTPAPASHVLEEKYYIDYKHIICAIENLVK